MKPSILDPRRNSFATSLLVCLPLVFRVSTHLTLMGSFPVLCLTNEYATRSTTFTLFKYSTSSRRAFRTSVALNVPPLTSQNFKTPACCGLERCVAVDDSLCLWLSLSASSSVSLFLPINDVTLIFRGTVFRCRHCSCSCTPSLLSYQCCTLLSTLFALQLDDDDDG